jgi:glycosyltransferase involved in cell wall biosynthesis
MIVIRVHFHSDCGYFAGCENMLPPLFTKLSDDSRFQLTFSYRYSSKYVEGLKKKIQKPVLEFPRNYPNFDDQSTYPKWIPRFFRSLLIRSWLLFGGPILFVYETLNLYKLFYKLKPEVLHVNNGVYPGAPSARAAIIAGKLSRIPLKIMVVNNLALDYRSIHRIMDYPVDYLVSKFTDIFVTGSHSAMARLVEILKLPSNKTTVIPNGISPPISSPVEKLQSQESHTDFAGTTFAVIGELVPRKGHIYLLQAILLLKNSGVIQPHKFRLLVAGEGPIFSELKDFVKENSLEELVFFLGYIDNFVELLPKFDVVVLPSIAFEDFPYVVLEAMSVAKPVIGTYIAGIPEQIDHEITGILVSPKNVTDLAQAIELLHTQPFMRKALGDKGKEKFLAHFTSVKAVDKYLELYSCWHKFN